MIEIKIDLFNKKKRKELEGRVTTLKMILDGYRQELLDLYRRYDRDAATKFTVTNKEQPVRQFVFVDRGRNSNTKNISTKNVTTK